MHDCLTEGEEIKSHDLFAKLTSKKTITGEDEEEESELEYLTEIREVRDKQPELFARIKRLPKKARSTTTARRRHRTVIPSSSRRLLTYFRQGRLDKFFLAQQAATADAAELDFSVRRQNSQARRHIGKAADNSAQDFYHSARQEQSMPLTSPRAAEHDDAIPSTKAARTMPIS